ncbi:MAG: hypothetical protein WD467_03080 [Candidatus Saccharimonadales bacterium]
MTNKANKVNISIGGSSSTTAAANTPQISSFRKQSSVTPPPPSDKAKSVTTPARAASTAKKVSPPHPILHHPDAKDLDGGFTADMYKPGQKIDPTSAKQAVPKQARTLDGTVFSKPTAAAPNAAETDSLYDSDEDFYTSKLDPKRRHQTPSLEKTIDSARVNPFTLVRFWVILAIFLLTATTGLVMLYQLEQVNAGSGIIFEWTAWFQRIL